MSDRARRAVDDRWRVLAAVAVVGIHAAGGYEGALAQHGRWLSTDGLAAVVSQWARFSVPLFMVFSGYGLALGERARGVERLGRADMARFWRRRLARIAPPYLAFTVAGLWWADRLSWAAIGPALLRGTGDYHLYFLSFLLQGYLIWPLVRRPSGWRVAALLGLAAVFASPMHLIWPGRPHIPAWIVVHWAGYLALGAWLVGRRSRPRAESQPRPRSMWVARAAWLVALAAVLVEYGWWRAQGPAAWSSPGDFNHFCRWTVIAYAGATVWWWQRAAARSTLGPAAIARAGRLAGWTFTVYLIHPWVLRGLGYLPLPRGWGWDFAALFPIAAGLSFAAVAALDRGLSRDRAMARRARRVVGLG